MRENFYGGFFIHDEWRAHPRLTVSAGLRYERESVLDDHDNFAPRLALVFDPKGSGYTVETLRKFLDSMYDMGL